MTLIKNMINTVNLGYNVLGYKGFSDIKYFYFGPDFSNVIFI